MKDTGLIHQVGRIATAAFDTAPSQPKLELKELFVNGIEGDSRFIYRSGLSAAPGKNSRAHWLAYSASRSLETSIPRDNSSRLHCVLFVLLWVVTCC